MTGSAIYEGWVTHRRRGEISHAFRYRVFMPLFELEELPQLLDPIPLWSARRFAPARFRADDHLGGGAVPLAERARDVCQDRLCMRPKGAVRLLANPRYLGAGFNPVSFFFLDGESGGLEAVVAEVTNTPWREHHAYALDARVRDPSGAVRARLEKRLHVSPFQTMEQQYEVSVTEPGDDLRVVIRSLEQGREVLTAKMSLRRRTLTRRRMMAMLFRYPPQTAATLARIYLNAGRLKLKGASVQRRPRPAPH